MKYTVEVVEMNTVVITTENGEMFFYSLDEMTMGEALDRAISEM